MTTSIYNFCISPTSTIQQAIKRIDKTGEGIVLVVDAGQQLLGTITDGDIRRAILAGISMEFTVGTLLEQHYRAGKARPIVAPAGASNTDLLALMNEHQVRHIPLLDSSRKVVDIGLMSQLVKNYELPLSAVIMAGGFGRRLSPMTDDRPKPMLPVGDRPLLELIVEQLQAAGIRQLTISTHYKGNVITKHFGDGGNFGLAIKYINEKEPLGTAGAIQMVEPDAPILVINGDVLTRVDFRAMFDFHLQHQADLTVAIKEESFEIPYGVVSLRDLEVVGITEKPQVRQFINAGIYLLGTRARRLVPTGQHCDMPDLIGKAIAKNLRVVGFPIREYWLDIGKMEDYKRAQTEWENQEKDS